MTPRQQLDEALATLQGFDNPARPDGLMGSIFKFQSVVWGSGGWNEGLEPAVEEALRLLALDLDFYEPDSDARLEDQSFFGAERAIELIQKALVTIGRI